jgi:cyclopropane fatty-acyl-phospholipid synthase-like methyltransferase
MTSVDGNLFYQAYDRHGEGTVLKKKHVRQYRKDFIQASAFMPGMSVLELGCGNGLFLKYLNHIGVADFVGVDGDGRVLGEIPPDLAAHVTIADFDDFFRALPAERRFDRVVLFDVLEHFGTDDAVALLAKIASVLKPQGRVVIRVPNLASPFGLGMYFNDVTHRSAFSPGSIRQVARAAGYETVAVVPQAYSTTFKEVRERVFTKTVSWFLAAPPAIWSANMIAVLQPR